MSTSVRRRADESERNRRAALDFFEALSNDEVERRDWLTEDVEFVVVDADHREASAAIPWFGLHKRIANVEASLERILKARGVSVDRAAGRVRQRISKVLDAHQGPSLKGPWLVAGARSVSRYDRPRIREVSRHPA
jgi:hypothetical protein